MAIKKLIKLSSNISKKETYTAHIRAFNQALKHGLILKKVHWVIMFQQSALFKVYIDLNTKLRLQTAKEF